ncbi:MAG: S41 family peptidase, partial [Terriglobia bacterium]
RVAYVRLATFNETTREELEDALDELGREDLQGLVLDLRGNPGGLLNQAVQVADLFLDKNQLIVSHHGRNQRERSYRARGGNQGHSYPLVVLIDRFSASAAEIVAGAVQDHDRGLIVGETSFGKGLVQTVYPLSHNTGLALTSARYYTPSGRLIQRDYRSVSLYSYYYGQHSNGNTLDPHRTDGGRTVYGGGGITPDVEVKLPELNDFQQELLRRVILYPSNIGVGDFARRYLARYQDVARDFEVTTNVVDEFRRFLIEKGVGYAEPDIQDNLDWLKVKIKREIFTSVFGRDEGHRVGILADPQVQRAIELLPQARELAENTRRIIARQQQNR